MPVRAASPDDLARLVDLEQVCEGDDAWSENLIREGIEGLVPTTTWLVSSDSVVEVAPLVEVRAERAAKPRIDDACIAGYAVVSVAGDIAELQRIGVSPEQRRAGIATDLLSAAVVHGKNAGADRMLLEVREDNHAALNLYASKGFVEIDRRPRYYKDGATAVVMRLPLMKGCG